MSMIHSKTKIVFVASLLAFSLGLVAFFGFMHVIGGKQQVLDKQTQSIARLEARRTSLSALVRTAKESESERTLLRSFILEEDDVIDLLARIEHLSLNKNVSITTNALVVNPRNENFEELQLSVAAQGSYVDVLHVLTLLETLPYESHVAQVRIEKGSQVGSATWSGVFDIRVTKYKKK